MTRDEACAPRDTRRQLAQSPGAPAHYIRGRDPEQTRSDIFGFRVARSLWIEHPTVDRVAILTTIDEWGEGVKVVAVWGGSDLSGLNRLSEKQIGRALCNR